MAALLPATAVNDRERISALLQRLGHTAVKNALLEQLWTCGNQGRIEAVKSWQAYGLDYTRRSAIGLALQHLLEAAERHVDARSLATAQGEFHLGNTVCAVTLSAPADPHADFSARVAIDVIAHPTPAVSALTLQGRST